MTAGPRRPELVGRTDEWRELERARRRSAAGEFGCLLLVGDPGVGRSRLAAQFVVDRAATERGGLTVLTTRAHHLGATTAFGAGPWLRLPTAASTTCSPTARCR